MLADQLFYIMLAFSVVTLLNVALVRDRRAADGSVTEQKPGLPVRILLVVAMAAVGAVAFIWVRPGRRPRGPCRLEPDRHRTVPLLISRRPAAR